MKLTKAQKRFVSMLIVFSMIVSLFTIVPVVSAYEESYNCVLDGYEYEYQLLEGDTARVIGVYKYYNWDDIDFQDDIDNEDPVELFEFPSELEGHTVTEIICELYSIDAESIRIPDTVKVLDYVFYWCSFDTVYLPASVESVGKNTFTGARIKNLEIDPGCKALVKADGFLYYADSADPILYLGSTEGAVTVPDGVTSISSRLFENCNASEIILPETVTQIGPHAFSNCDNLTEIKIPDSVTDLAYTFPYCHQLKTVTLPSKLKSIDSITFSGCASLSEITLPSTLESIGSSAFAGCESLKSITIPGSVRRIRGNAFSGSGLEDVTISNGVQSIEYKAFFNCEGLKSVTIPSSVDFIDEQAFGYYLGPWDENSGISYWDYYDNPNKVDGFTIYGVVNTAAQQYAEENGFTFIEISAYIVGDPDGDSEVTILDATAIQRHLADLPVSSFDAEAADADEDKELSILDATCIQRYLAGLPSNENIGKSPA